MRKLWLPLVLAAAASLLVAALVWDRTVAPPPSPTDAQEVAAEPFAAAPSPDADAAPGSHPSSNAPPEASVSAAPETPDEAADALAEPEPGVSLERLLTLPDDPAAEKGLDLDSGARPPKAPAPGEPGFRDWVYVERYNDEAQVTDQTRTRQQTDVGVRVPVGSAARIRGGVRVESSEEGETQGQDTERTPTVGVEVDF